MPLPDDKIVNETANDLVSTLKGAYGTPPGYRPAHAKGILVKGEFIPTKVTSELSSAHHLNHAVHVTARFSSSTGVPQIPDNDDNADPRGFAVRFHLPSDNDGKRVHTDIVAHSVDKFATRTGAEFLEFLRAVGASQNTSEKPTPMEKWLETHPETLAFLEAPKPAPVSFATEQFYGVVAVKLIAADKKETFIRYRIVPNAGLQTLSHEEKKAKGNNYLVDEIKERIGKTPVLFTLQAHIAEANDPTDDCTKRWPETRRLVDLGQFKFDALIPDDRQAAEQKDIVFDPVPRVEGLAPSADPLYDVRAAVYLKSGRERRSA